MKREGIKIIIHNKLTIVFGIIVSAVVLIFWIDRLIHSKDLGELLCLILPAIIAVILIVLEYRKAVQYKKKMDIITRKSTKRNT